MSDLLALDFDNGAPELDSPALNQTHPLAATDLSIGPLFLFPISVSSLQPSGAELSASPLLLLTPPQFLAAGPATGPRRGRLVTSILWRVELYSEEQGEHVAGLCRVATDW